MRGGKLKTALELTRNNLVKLAEHSRVVEERAKQAEARIEENEAAIKMVDDLERRGAFPDTFSVKDKLAYAKQLRSKTGEELVKQAALMGNGMPTFSAEGQGTDGGPVSAQPMLSFLTEDTY